VVCCYAKGILVISGNHALATCFPYRLAFFNALLQGSFTQRFFSVIRSSLPSNSGESRRYAGLMQINYPAVTRAYHHSLEVTGSQAGWLLLSLPPTAKHPLRVRNRAPLLYYEHQCDDLDTFSSPRLIRSQSASTSLPHKGSTPLK